METVWLVIETPRGSIHDDIDLMYTKMKCSPDEFDHDQVEELLRSEDLLLLKSSRDEKEAKVFGEKFLRELARDYTKLINKLPDLEPVEDRPFLVRLGEELTKTARVYLMKKIDYEKLKAAFPTVRLATDEEVDATESFISCLIPLDYELLKSLHLQYFRVISPPEGLLVEHYYEFCQGFEESRKLLGELREYCLLLSQESELVLKEDAVGVAEKLFGNKAEETVDQMVKTFQDLAAGREVDLSGDLLINYETAIDGVDQVNVKYA